MPFGVQTGELEYGASADTGDNAVTAVTSIGAGGQAFARLTTTMAYSAGPAAGTTATRNPDDMGAGCTMTSTTNVRSTRYSTGENVDYHNRYEVLEFPTTGENSAIVRYAGDITVADTVAQVDTAVASITDLTDCVAFVVGVRSDRISGVNLHSSLVTAKMVNVSGDKVRLDRGNTTGELIVSVIVLELTGSAWSVQQIDISHTATGDQSTTITDVTDWSNAFIVGVQRLGGSAGQSDRGTCVIRPGATTTAVRTYVSDAGGTNDFTLYICKNANITVDHIDSVTGGKTDHPGSGGQPQVVNTAITAVSSLALTSVIATGSHIVGANRLNTSCFAYQLTSTTNLQWERCEDQTVVEWAAQIIQWPAVSAETFDVQTGVLEYGATEDTDTATVTAVTSVGAGGHAFARLANSMFCTAGPAAGTTANRAADDMGSTITMTDTSTVSMARDTSAVNEDVHTRFEVLALDSSGENSAIVRYAGDITVEGGTSQFDTAVASITTLADCVAFIVGVRHDDSTSGVADRWSFTAEMINVSGDKVRLRRGDSAGVAIVSVVVVEFTGSAWSVEKKNISHTATGDQSTTVTDVSDWTTAFIVGGHRCNSGDLTKATWVIRPGATTTSVRTYVANAASTNDLILYVVKNANLTVTHYDSITGGETNHPGSGGQPQTVNTAITAVSDLTKTSVIASVSTASTELSGGCWSYQLTTTTNLQWERSNDNGANEWAAQVIEWPVAVANAPGMMVMSA